ncbi:hypothetical protein L915_14630 [Phytophthora nicotianae]|uniref:Uncharacterized protein n=3 Tax=Phytophthora nicotianae TaxID=4792 RepID=V9EJB6_PHYNI|nr:hypothetical protein F443_15078 [Phytophthora nicotianae P1569]ETK79525.1 hypothetical protein L915_14630 [Phytophthora nicotianae]ETM39363.1 hypothetical protein L914_14481 [Phytophthora nicotianae]ETO68068.1 hypothetical protein F444_15062 [Phytophthora nicotianae P1976]
MGMSGFVDEVSLNIYLWMRWVIQRNLPITEVKNKLTREAVTIKSTTVRTMKVCMRYVTGKVGETISSDMGNSFCLMFDEWTSHSLQFPEYLHGLPDEWHAVPVAARAFPDVWEPNG